MNGNWHETDNLKQQVRPEISHHNMLILVILVMNNQGCYVHAALTTVHYRVE